MTVRQRALWLAAVAAAGSLAVVQAFAAYRISPAIAVGAPIAMAVLAAIAWRPMLGIYAGLLAMPIQTTVSAGFNFTAPEALFMAAGASAVANWIVDREPRPRIDGTLLAFGGLCAVAALGIFFAPDTFVLRKIVVFATGFLIAAVYISNQSFEDIERGLVLLAFIGGVVGVVAMITTSEQALQSGGQVVSNRAEAGFAHPNVLALFLVLTLAPALVLAFRGSGWRRLIMGVSAAAIFGGLMLTLTRGGIIGGAVSMLVLLTWRPFRRYALATLAVIALVASLNASALQSSKEITLVRDRLSTVTSQQQVEANPRFRIWEKTVPMIAEHAWLGVGEGNYPVVSPRYGLLDIDGLFYDHAHNVFLTVAAETGLIGLAFFLAFLYGGVRHVRTALKRRDSRTFPPALGAAAGLTGLMVTSMSEYPPRTNSILATIMFLVGSLVGLSRIAREDAQRPVPSGPGDLDTAGDDQPDVAARPGRSRWSSSGRTTPRAKPATP